MHCRCSGTTHSGPSAAVELKGSIFQWPADRPWASRGILFVAGCLFTTAFAPFGFTILVPLLLVPLLYVYLTVSPRDAGWLSFYFGFGLFLSGTYWIYISVVVFGEAPAWIAVVLMLGLVLIMAFLLLRHWLVDQPPFQGRTMATVDCRPVDLGRHRVAAWLGAHRISLAGSRLQPG